MSKDNQDGPKSNPSSGELAARHISQIETLWPMLRQAHGGSPAQINAAQEVILKRYRPAVYRYLLACVGDADAADELAQEFALRFVRGDFRNANPERGRFRDLLKSALYHLVIDHHKKKKKNLPGLSAGPEPAAPGAFPPASDRRLIPGARARPLPPPLGRGGGGPGRGWQRKSSARGAISTQSCTSAPSTPTCDRRRWPSSSAPDCIAS